MILVDANLLIYAVNRDSPHHARARNWWEEILSGSEEVGLTWIVVLAFIRITTRPGILSNPLSPERAVAYIEEWLAQPYVNLTNGGEKQWQIFRNLQLEVGTAGNLTSDTMLASIALELGATIYSADYDFRRFAGVLHVNPIQSY